MASKDRILRLKEETRINILDASLKIVKEEGWQALSMRKIADKIEYTAPIIYEYFSNKEAILLELTRKGFLILSKNLQEAKSRHRLPAKQLEAMWFAYWNFAFVNKHFYQLMFGVNIAFCYKKDSLLEYKKGVIALFESLLISALDHNENLSADAALKRSTLWCILHGLVSINMTSRIIKEEGKMERVLDDAVKGFIRSLKKEE